MKYVIEQSVARGFMANLNGYMTSDPHATSEAGYTIHSVYWDSPDLALFWEKIDGIKYRRKLRFRWYRDVADEAYIEIKQRIDQTVQKRRVRWPVARLNDAFVTRQTSDTAELDGVASEAMLLTHALRLRPTMAVAYRRQAYFGTYEPWLRVTFDTNLRYHAHELEIGKGFSEGRYLLDPRLAVMEIKFNDHVPQWMCRLVARFNLTSRRVSKYGRAVDLQCYGGQLS